MINSSINVKCRLANAVTKRIRVRDEPCRHLVVPGDWQLSLASSATSEMLRETVIGVETRRRGGVNKSRSNSIKLCS